MLRQLSNQHQTSTRTFYVNTDLAKNQLRINCLAPEESILKRVIDRLMDWSWRIIAFIWLYNRWVQISAVRLASNRTILSQTRHQQHHHQIAKISSRAVHACLQCSSGHLVTTTMNSVSNHCLKTILIFFQYLTNLWIIIRKYCLGWKREEVRKR